MTEADTCRKYVVPKLLAAGWDNEPHSIAEQRARAKLAERGIDFDQLALQAGHPESDPLDLLCHLAFNAPLRTRRERADRLKRDAEDFFGKFGPEARAVLNDLLDKYTEHGATQFQFPDALKIPPLSERGSVSEIAGYFGGADQLRNAVNQLQTLLYAA